MGIPADQKDMIFERFRQGSQALTRDYEGSGLGLSISKAYVEMLGGKIWVISEPGKGSAFYFTIPHHREKRPGNAIKDTYYQDEVKPAIRKLKVLVADDDEASDLLITLVLKKYSSEILHAATGIECLEACRNHPDIDLVLMDIKMPVMDGYQAAGKIREFNQDVIIIAQTAFALSGDRDNALAAGCDDYLSKPIDQPEMMEIISRFFPVNE
jgi:CheY-like chemotaxis protein